MRPSVRTRLWPDARTLQRVIAESKRKSPFIWRAKGAGEGATTGMVIATDGIAALWSCASDKLAEAEKLR